MKFDTPLIQGRLIRRYKRFLADVELPDGSTVTAHTPNTGSMKGCAEPGSRVWLRDTQNPKRKYPLSWELVQPMDGVIIGINTGLANHLVREAIENGVITELSGYQRIRSEVRYGVEKSRIDLLLSDARGRSQIVQDSGKQRNNCGNLTPTPFSAPFSDCYVEVKNVTLVEEGTAYFPDAVTERGAKHLRELAAMARQGNRAVIFYCVQRGDAGSVQPADGIDPLYGQTLRDAVDQGVEALAYQAKPTPEGITLNRSLSVKL